MMKEYNVERIDKWLDENKENIIRDMKRIIKIPSVSKPGVDEYPFGKGCKDALEEMLQLGREHGFCTENYEDYVGSIGVENKNLKNTIGFWNHLDIVPIGNNWKYDPFDATYKEPFLIGRGVGDNKGPAVGMLYLMKAFRELEIPLNHELRLFVGCDEEKGMRDMEYYTSHYETPALSIVPDTGFPVCYGEKGILEGEMITKNALSKHFVSFKGGIASNMIPDLVEAVLKGDDVFLEKAAKELAALENADLEVKKGVFDGEDVLHVTYHGISRHSAFPYGSKNAIHGLSKSLAQISVLSKDDRECLDKIAELSERYLGEVPGIAYKDEVSGDTTCAATMIDLREGKICVTLNIRYAITADNEKDLAALSEYAEKNNFEWVMASNSKPNYFPKESPIVELLTGVFNQATGEERQSYVMGGGTYARKLPNAVAFGLGGIKESEEEALLRKEYIEEGHGGAHEPDEVLNINTFMQGLKIYARAMIALNEVELYTAE